MATLPLEIIAAEILPRLPANSLLRFKCVCKFFQTLISSSEFIDSHLRRSLSSNTNRRLLLIQNSDKRLYSVEFNTHNFVALRLPVLQRFDGYSSFVLGSCNGLLCFVVINDTLFNFVLFNPSIGFCKEIGFHVPEILVLGTYVTFGFGFEYENDDYKLVIIFDYFDAEYYDLGDEAVRREVMVYSARTGSRKRSVEILSPKDSIIWQNTALIGNNLLHCMFWSSSKNKHRCGCFDLCTEQWGNDVPLPDYDCGGKEKLHDVVDMGVFEGCLCLLTKNLQTSTVDVWIMKEYGVKESWTKLLDVSDSFVTTSLKMVPISYGKGSEDEILLKDDDTSELVWYYRMCKTIRRAEICDCISEAFMCKDSLITIPGGEQLKWK